MTQLINIAQNAGTLMQIPQFIQKKNAIIADSAITNISQALKRLNRDDLWQIGKELIDKKTTTIENKLKEPTKLTLDDAIKQYKGVIIGGAVGILFIGILIGRKL